MMLSQLHSNRIIDTTPKIYVLPIITPPKLLIISNCCPYFVAVFIGYSNKLGKYQVIAYRLFIPPPTLIVTVYKYNATS